MMTMTNRYRNEPCPLCHGAHLLNGRLCTHCKGDGFVPVRQKSLGEIVASDSVAFTWLMADVLATRKILSILKEN